LLQEEGVKDWEEVVGELRSRVGREERCRGKGLRKLEWFHYLEKKVRREWMGYRPSEERRRVWLCRSEGGRWRKMRCDKFREDKR
jgi:hypothetical protein